MICLTSHYFLLILKCVLPPPDQAVDPVHPEPGEVRPELRHPGPHALHTPADRAQREERRTQQVRTPHPIGSQAGAAPAVRLQRYDQLLKLETSLETSHSFLRTVEGSLFVYPCW